MSKCTARQADAVSRFLAVLLAAAMGSGCVDSARPPAESREPPQAAESASAGAAGESARALDPGYLQPPGGMAPLLEGIGPVRFPLSSRIPEARAYFNQALTFSYGFNHAEAERSFREAARLDPECGACWWGVALVNGPNINKAMEPGQVQPAWEALQKAQTLRAGATPLEKALIDALASRYAADGGERAALDWAYAEAMRTVAERFPDDPHVLALYAEALMDLYPWSYWHDDGSPKEHTAALVTALERAMALDPNHPGALHLYIHAMEQFTPGRALVAADTLGSLVPVAGHLVHMPSHIYLRVGRYHDAVQANIEASLADEDYISQCNAQGFYPAGYYPHNIHFLWYAAMMEGQRDLALATAERLHGKIDHDMARQFGSIQRYLAVRGVTYVRFGLWDAALAEPPAPDGMPMTAFMRDYVQGEALAATGDLAGARQVLQRMEDTRSSDALAAVMDRQGDIAGLLTEIAVRLVDARIARAEGDGEAEIARLRSAVAAQDALPYTEPPFWHFPVRQMLGAAYLRWDQPDLAAQTFREDLEAFPANGWSLHGLRQARAALGEDASDMDAAVAAAWRFADIEPSAGL